MASALSGDRLIIFRVTGLSSTWSRPSVETLNFTARSSFRSEFWCFWGNWLRSSSPFLARRAEKNHSSDRLL